MENEQLHTSMRTNTCGGLRAVNAGESVALCGWVDNWRDQGGVVFIDIRDRYGRTQVTFRREENAELNERASKLRTETVIRVNGLVRKRPDEAVNPNMPTGEIEIVPESFEVLAESERTPFEILDQVSPSAAKRCTSSATISTASGSSRWRRRCLPSQHPKARVTTSSRAA
jgi:aspartyl-tRNA synthetase